MKVRAVIATDAPCDFPSRESDLLHTPHSLHITPGMNLPDRLPMCLEHNMATTHVLGSIVDLRVEPVGEYLGITGELVFSKSHMGDQVRQDVEAGHVRFMSIAWDKGRRVEFPEGEHLDRLGRTVYGPFAVEYDWVPLEATPTIRPKDSLCKISLPK